MGAKANASGALAALAALQRARQHVSPETKTKRPTLWLCPACGNKLDAKDRCKFHAFSLGLAQEIIDSHCRASVCGCRFCERVHERVSNGESREQAIGETAAELAPSLVGEPR